MKLRKFPKGPLFSNMYLLDTDSGIFIIDPSVDPQRADSGLPSDIDYILITHGHFDHIYALDKWRDKYPSCRIFMSAEDMPMLTDPYLNGSSLFADRMVFNSKADDLSKLKIDGLKVIRTPGHTRGGVCFFYEKEGIMFTGDTLFKGSAGRCDLPGGNSRELLNSMSVLKSFDPSVIIYPGHGPSSTIREELLYNPFFN